MSISATGGASTTHRPAPVSHAAQRAPVKAVDRDGDNDNDKTESAATKAAESQKTASSGSPFRGKVVDIKA